ncbi:sporulation protein YpjB [Paenibacillus sp. YYML68]|uniref:sporulation protein YpjB n=1 Tax=Paenibacillus sp. YYML68 TaxID=2909250 RepID=UPI002491E89C|nr:sporulation protein YpjB [Paenibacillus sp. YYML68]
MIWFLWKKWLAISIMCVLAMSMVTGCGSKGESKDAKESETNRSAAAPSQEQLKQIKLLNETADGMYQKVQKGDIAGGRELLLQLSDQVTNISFDGIASVEGINALTETVVEGKRVLNAVKFDPAAGQIAAAKIRLATDALTHANQPLWLQFYKQLQDDVNAIEQAAKTSDKTALKNATVLLEQHYAIVHPSLIISRPEADVERMDSLITFIQTQADNQGMPYRNVLNAVPPLRQALDKLFMKRETTAFLPYPEPQNPLLWTAIFGSVIMAALGFAGWRLWKKDDGLVRVKRSE